ncbi:hypothetical protein FK529_12750 [Tsukamurella asaccharolytica]|uniref:Phthiocerol/phthiodiolone dimycocerosyl transferase n=1 Tax=Tsukamurella asaccharolytica TaxID=2592067 RepID=A0A5C5R9L7_9ACTN|nr:hypothetical protein [Tsukamurella asaccharolytica]TWS18851.1 hypothetical protein FK529_12750 [Tsukamurella asaccharolytica]
MKSATNCSVSTATIRELTTTEAFFLIGDGLYVGYGVTADGALDLDALQRAAIRLSDAHPGLRARIVTDAPTGDAPASPTGAFVARESPTPVAVTRSVGPADGTAPLPDVALAQGSALAGVHVVTDPGGGHLVYLLVHHALADGHHALALLQSLWTAYTAIVTGTEEAPLAPTDFPKPLEDLLTERGYSSASDLPAEAPTVAGAVPAADGAFAAPADEATPALRRIQLTRDETAALIGYGHRAGRTVNQLVSAAFIAATATTRDLGATRVVYGYPVDLRRRLGEPAAGFTEITNALGMAFFQAGSDDAGLDDLAAQVGDALARDLAAGTVQRPLAVGAAVQPPEGSTVAVLTNWGPVPHLPTPPGLTLTDFHPALHVAAGSPSDTAAWDALAATLTIGIVSSFQGRLSIDVSGSAVSDVLVTETLRNLRSFTLGE